MADRLPCWLAVGRRARPQGQQYTWSAWGSRGPDLVPRGPDLVPPHCTGGLEGERGVSNIGIRNTSHHLGNEVAAFGLVSGIYLYWSVPYIPPITRLF